MFKTPYPVSNPLIFTRRARFARWSTPADGEKARLRPARASTGRVRRRFPCCAFASLSASPAAAPSDPFCTTREGERQRVTSRFSGPNRLSRREDNNHGRDSEQERARRQELPGARYQRRRACTCYLSCIVCWMRALLDRLTRRKAVGIHRNDQVVSSMV